jgi:hypothetical protein
MSRATHTALYGVPHNNIRNGNKCKGCLRLAVGDDGTVASCRQIYRAASPYRSQTPCHPAGSGPTRSSTRVGPRGAGGAAGDEAVAFRAHGLASPSCGAAAAVAFAFDLIELNGS